MSKKSSNKWPWPWKREEEATWGGFIIAAYGEITDIDRKYHMTLLGKNRMKLSNDEYSLAMRRRLMMEPRPVDKQPKKGAGTKSSVCGKADQELLSKDKESTKTVASKNQKSVSQKEQRLAAIRASREEKPELTHKQRLEELKSLNPALWGEMGIKSFKRLILIDNKENKNKTGGTSMASLSRSLENMARLDDYSDEGGYGYSDDDMDDLLCQGVKPWDDDADDVLAALDGAYDF